MSIPLQDIIDKKPFAEGMGETIAPGFPKIDFAKTTLAVIYSHVRFDSESTWGHNQIAEFIEKHHPDIAQPASAPDRQP